jgi:hypothetical protein
MMKQGDVLMNVLERAVAMLTVLRCSVYLIYWYKSTNTDTAFALSNLVSGHSRIARSVANSPLLQKEGILFLLRVVSSMYVYTYIRMYAYTYVCMLCMYVCMYVCIIHVCVYIYIYIYVLAAASERRLLVAPPSGI